MTAGCRWGCKPVAEKRRYLPKTDLNELKALCHRLLELEIGLTEMSPLVVKHPFTDSGIVGLRKEGCGMDVADLTKDVAALHTWREHLAKQIDKVETAFSLFLWITKPYKLAFLKFAAPFLSEKDMALFLSHAWTLTEAPNTDPNLSRNELLGLFRSVDSRLLMDEDEYDYFNSLDDVVTVYRGVTPYNAKEVKALSWTLSKEAADWFAHRFGEQGTVYEAQIQKEHICAVFLGRNESEVIVDPEYLMGISPVQEMEQDAGGLKMS